MTQINFSLIIPTRERLALLKLCITSFFICAKYPEQIEFIILSDLDDAKTLDIINTINKFNINATVLVQQRSDWLIRDYNNKGGMMGKGKYIWILNDDVIMETNNWDQIILDNAEEFLKDKMDRIFYGIPDDDTHSRIKDCISNFGSCFPVLTYETVQCQEGVMAKEVSSHCADTKLYEVFKRIKANRILDIQDKVKLMHFCKHNGTREEDDTQKRLVKNAEKCSELTPAQYQYYIDKLNNRIDQFQNVTISQ